MTVSKMTDIVMTTWNRPEITYQVIRTLAKNTTTPSRLIVVDNGSEEDMQDELIKMNESGLIDKLILLENNIGLEPAKNIGLKEVESEYFISTDNDCLPMKPDKDGDWLSKLIDLMERHKQYAAISCRTQVMIGTGNIFDGKEEFDIIQFPWPGGSLRIMRTDLVKRVGGWNDNIKSRGNEERYICGELHKLGWETGFAVRVKCYHMFGNGNWGYLVPPEEHGHNPVCHPAIQNGDDEEEIEKWLS